MSTVWGVLVDTVSIQKYVFQSNKLKDNLGASFLIEKIYKEYLSNALCKVFGKAFDINAWKDNPEEIKINKGDPFEVGYIGGGSAFLMFTEEQKAIDFIKTWTKLLLVHTPGVTTGVAISKFDLENKNFSQEREKLFDELRKNKSQYIPETTLPRHGITAECSRSGLSMEIWDNIVDSYVSAGSNAVIEASKPAKDYINKKYAKILGTDFCFTNELDKLGRISGEDSHIAIVHIDGNSMGERFKAAETLVDIRKLSNSVAEATENAFIDLLKHIVKKYDDIMESLGFDKKSKDSKFKYPVDDNNFKILPIRSVILGGDDITFICDGKLGIYFSKIFLEAFEKEPVYDGEKLTACAGVAIIKTRYPFYRGYRLAEELCGNAKKANKKDEKDKLNSYIDFHISMGGLFGNLEVIRKQYTDTPQGKLLFRPYKVLPKDNKDEKSFELLVKNAGTLKKFPKNKIKEMRDVMNLSKEATKTFVKKLEYRDLSLPEIPGRSEFAESIFDNGETVYFDMIELMEFYPDFELQD